jgi:flagellar biosynthesis protein
MDLHPKLKLAVALKYKQDQDTVPLVVASGKGLLAEAILKRAAEAGVPIHPDSDLAEMLGEVDVGDAIPEELYEVVAQIMAMVYRMDSSLARRLGPA